MTQKSLEKLLKKLEEDERFIKAANKPMFGEVSYDRAANEIFGPRLKEALEEARKGQPGGGIIEVDNVDLEYDSEDPDSEEDSEEDYFSDALSDLSALDSEDLTDS